MPGARTVTRVIAGLAAVVTPLVGIVVLSSAPATAATSTLTVVSYTAAPHTVDVSTGDADATIVVRINGATTDATGFDHGTITLSSTTPSAHALDPLRFSAGQRVSGTVRDGTYDVDVALPQGTTAGSYNPSIALTDASGTAAGPFTPTGSALTVVRTNDTAPPALTGSVTATPSSVDVTQDDRDVTYSATLTDAVSGLVDAQLTLTDADGGEQPLDLDRVAGTAQNGTWTGTATVPLGSDAGTWTVSELVAHDGYGNTLDQTTALGGAITVRSTPDPNGPAITAVGSAAKPIDTSNGPAQVVIPVHVTAGPAGVSSGNLSFTNDADPYGPSATGTFSGPPDTGTSTNGTWNVTVVFDARSAPGQWTLTAAQVSNAQGASTTYDQDGDGAPPAAHVQVTSTADATAPTLTSLTIGPPTVNTGNYPDHSARIIGRIGFTDPAGTPGNPDGVSGLAGAEIVLQHGTDPPTTIDLTADDITSGTATQGTLTFDQTIYAAAAGSWTVTGVTLTDLAGNAAVFDSTQYPAGSRSSVLVDTTSTDTQAPVLTTLTLPATVDTSAAAKDVNVTIGVTDPGAHPSGLAGASLVLSSPTGRDHVEVDFPATPTTGDDQSGTYTASATIGRYVEAGAWVVSAVDLADAAGNATHLGRTDVATALGHAAPTLTVGSAVDTTAPTLTAITTPGSVDAGSGVPLTVHIDATDAGSGLAQAAVDLTGPAGRTAHGTTAVDSSVIAAGATGVDVDVTVPRFNSTGSWTVTGIDLVDADGNHHTYAASDLVGFGTHAATVIGTPDVVAPQAGELRIAPVSTVGGATEADVLVRLRDVASGVATAHLTLVSPNQRQSLGTDLNLIAGTANDGFWQGTLEFPYWVDQGSWTVGPLTIDDAAGNEASLTAADLGASATIAVTGPSDRTMPTLTGLAITPSSFDTTVGDTTVTFTMTATDTQSGVFAADVVVLSPSGNGTQVTLHPTGTSTPAQANYTGTLTVPAYSTAGSWRVLVADVSDLYGNTRTLAQAQLTGTGIANSFVVTGVRTTTTAPGAPRNVTAVVSGSTGATVSWTPPANTGGVTITGYAVTGAPAGACTTTGATTCSVSGLSPGGSYTFSVTATNSIGTGVASVPSVALVIPPVAPAAPANVMATSNPAGVALSWTAPSDTGGGAVTGYVVTPYLNGTAPQPSVLTVGPSTTTTITGLARGSAYAFTVAARNSGGTGSPSAPSPALTLAVTAPTAPTNAAATLSGATAATVTWTAPADTGGTAITGYTVSGTPGGSCTVTTTSCEITGLTKARSYSFTVTATNAVGPGVVSVASVGLLVPATAPGAPAIATATSDGGTGATVTWTAPADSGGLAITGYVVTPSVAGVVQPTLRRAVPVGTSVTITGLARGRTYTFTVAATNSIATGPESPASAAVLVPTTLPGRPGAVSARLTSPTSVTASWTAPTDTGGTAITGYTVTASPGGRTCTSVVTSCAITGLRNGTAYTFSVRAANAVGLGAGSTTSTPVVPRAPTRLTIATLPTTVRYGQAIAVTARLTRSDTDAAVPGETVHLRYRRKASTGAWSTLATAVTTSSSGLATFTTFRPSYSVELQLVFATAAGYDGSSSSARSVAVTRAISVSTSATRIKKGRTVRLTGSASPASAGRTVVLQRKSGARWIGVSSTRLSSTSAYAFTVKGSTTGRFSYRTTIAADASFATSVSATRTVRVA